MVLCAAFVMGDTSSIIWSAWGSQLLQAVNHQFLLRILVDDEDAKAVGIDDALLHPVLQYQGRAQGPKQIGKGIKCSSRRPTCSFPGVPTTTCALTSAPATQWIGSWFAYPARAQGPRDCPVFCCFAALL